MSKRNSTSERKKRKPTENVSTPLRRSSRLSNRYTPTPHNFPLSTSVYSRSSLGQYTEDSFGSEATSVLNESGQSVPPDFDQESEIVRHDHSYSKEPSTRRSRHGITHPQPIPEESREFSPNLYGLDGDEDELDLLNARHSRDYDLYTKERILTPPKSRPLPYRGPSLFSRIVSGICGFVYGIGSVVYLLFAIVVLCDIPVYSRSARACSRYFKSIFQSLAMLLIIFGIVFICITGPHVKYAPVTPPPVPTPLPLPHSTNDSELVNKLLAIVNNLKTELDSYRKGNSDVVEDLKKIVANNFNDLSKELQSLKGTFTSVVSKAVDTEKTDRIAMINHSESTILEKIQNNMENINDSVNAKLKEFVKPADNGSVNEVVVRMISQELVDSAVSEVKSLLDSAIREVNASVSQLKTKQAEDLKKAVEQWKKKQGQLESTLSQKITDIDEKFDKFRSSVSGDDAVRNEEIKKLSSEVHGATSKLQLTEKTVDELKDEIETIKNSSHVDEETVLRIIKEALDTFSADQIGRFDFALESAGGHVVDNSEPFDSSNTKAHFLGIPLPISISRTVPSVVIQPEVLPGDCWCFKGAKGFIVIKLANSAVLVDAVTLQHLPKVLSPTGTITSAIKSFTVKGMTSENDEGTILGSFEYNTDESPIQTFNFENKKAFGIIRFDVDTNHGNPDYTCIYRLRVHGTLQQKK